ncbi:hypothetical protein F5B20DRAFT_557034 [Whalleya microplaca]|nr:hypothetical protein F5B20DRAFT_557034 [Whalleya microplaca]
MLPKENEGVVDRDLEVYGIQNLSLVDSSALPIIVTANLRLQYTPLSNERRALSRKHGVSNDHLGLDHGNHDENRRCGII